MTTTTTTTATRRIVGKNLPLFAILVWIIFQQFVVGVVNGSITVAQTRHVYSSKADTNSIGLSMKRFVTYTARLQAVPTTIDLCAPVVNWNVTAPTDHIPVALLVFVNKNCSSYKELAIAATTKVHPLGHVKFLILVEPTTKFQQFFDQISNGWTMSHTFGTSSSSSLTKTNTRQLRIGLQKTIPDGNNLELEVDTTATTTTNSTNVIPIQTLQDTWDQGNYYDNVNSMEEDMSRSLSKYNKLEWTMQDMALQQDDSYTSVLPICLVHVTASVGRALQQVVDENFEKQMEGGTLLYLENHQRETPFRLGNSAILWAICFLLALASCCVCFVWTVQAELWAAMNYVPPTTNGNTQARRRRRRRRLTTEQVEMNLPLLVLDSRTRQLVAWNEQSEEEQGEQQQQQQQDNNGGATAAASANDKNESPNVNQPKSENVEEQQSQEQGSNHNATEATTDPSTTASTNLAHTAGSSTVATSATANTTTSSSTMTTSTQTQPLSSSSSSSPEQSPDATASTTTLAVDTLDSCCVICLDPYVVDESQLRCLPCQHVFHADCISKWLTERAATCPLCKIELYREQDPLSDEEEQQNGGGGLLTDEEQEQRVQDMEEALRLMLSFGLSNRSNTSAAAADPTSVSEESTQQQQQQQQQQAESSWWERGLWFGRRGRNGMVVPRPSQHSSQQQQQQQQQQSHLDVIENDNDLTEPLLNSNQQQEVVATESLQESESTNNTTTNDNNNSMEV